MTATAQTNQIEKWTDNLRKPVGSASLASTMLQASAQRISDLIPPGALMRFQRFMRQAMIGVSRNPSILNCSRESFLGAVMDAASLGLDPSGGSLGEAYLIPYGSDCKLQPGYRGLCVLARRSGVVLDIWADVVYEGDLFHEMKGSEHRIVHESRAVDRSDSKITHAYMCANLGSGVIHPHVIDREYINKCRAVSKSASKPGSVWDKWFPEMAKKTAVRQGIKMLPVSTEAIATALELSDQEFDHVTSEIVEPAPKGVSAVKSRLANRAESRLGTEDQPQDATPSDADNRLDGSTVVIDPSDNDPPQNPPTEQPEKQSDPDASEALAIQLSEASTREGLMQVYWSAAKIANPDIPLPVVIKAVEGAAMTQGKKGKETSLTDGAKKRILSDILDGTMKFS